MKITVLTFRVNEIIINKLIKKLYWVSGFLGIGEKNLKSSQSFSSSSLNLNENIKNPFLFSVDQATLFHFVEGNFILKCPQPFRKKWSVLSILRASSPFGVVARSHATATRVRTEETRVRVASSLARAFSHGLLRSLARSLKCSVTYWICQTQLSPFTFLIFEIFSNKSIKIIYFFRIFRKGLR